MQLAMVRFRARASKRCAKPCRRCLHARMPAGRPAGRPAGPPAGPQANHEHAGRDARMRACASARPLRGRARARVPLPVRGSSFGLPTMIDSVPTTGPPSRCTSLYLRAGEGIEGRALWR